MRPRHLQDDGIGANKIRETLFHGVKCLTNQLKYGNRINTKQE